MRDERFIEPSDQALPCIRCNKPLESIAAQNHPFGGAVFASHGQYGCTEFDPGNGSHLEINLCDVCIVVVAKTHIMYHPPKYSPTPPNGEARIHKSSLSIRVKNALLHEGFEKVSDLKNLSRLRFLELTGMHGVFLRELEGYLGRKLNNPDLPEIPNES